VEVLDSAMAKFPIHPQNPERICWGCEKFCPEDDMCCGNGTIRTPHPCELMGDDWYEWLQEHERPAVVTQAHGLPREA
jgi:Protein of unknown function (DUF3079)